MEFFRFVKWFSKRILYFFLQKKYKMRLLNRPPSFCLKQRLFSLITIYTDTFCINFIFSESAFIKSYWLYKMVCWSNESSFTLFLNFSL
jgi:hypothetical protein